MNSQDDKDRNLETARQLIASAAARGAQIVALPENFNFLGAPEAQLANAEPVPGPTVQCLADEARRHGIHILGGSILEVVAGAEKVYNTSLLLDPEGEIIARYRKVHLFDIEVEGQVQANESAIMSPGDEIVTVETEHATVGLSICYDLRFPELYRTLALAGTQIGFAPAAFTLYTGKDHWEVLVRARAIENALYMVAPAQYGRYPPHEQCFGASLIVDPWGTVVARAADREMAIVGEIDLAWQATMRSAVPVLRCRRPDVYVL